MTGSSADQSLELSALDGTNPLGFLAALGTLAAARTRETEARLRWKLTAGWIPVIERIATFDPRKFSEMVADALRGRPVSDSDEQARAEAEQAFAQTKKAVERASADVRRRGLRGEERRAAIETLVHDRDQKRAEWLRALTKAVPRPELAVGKHIDCTADEYREHATALASTAGVADREQVDLMASFGSDASVEKSGRISGTPFCFVTGSGHQYFLDTVRQLVEKVQPERVHEALFEPWRYLDERMSLRWDPIEARRYALMDRDPTAPGNEARTVWMANLLAYRALVLFPSAPSSRRLATTGWAQFDDGPAFTWPIWEAPADLETIRSLLESTELTAPHPNPSALRARGIAAAFRARRIKVGEGRNFKINFGPARAVLGS